MLRIEKTFLVEKLPEGYTSARASKIRQCYLIDSPDACRIREKDGDFTITRKMFTKQGDYSYREYEDFPISKAEFDILWNTAKSHLEKTRYYVASTVGYQVRLDEFEGPLKGLYLAELIFVSENSLRDISQLTWLGKDITNESWAYNQFLSTKSLAEIQEIIGPFGSHIGQNPIHT